ncbi:hypothetical protein ACXZ1K_07955 [Pedobacter sp. PWIIR3]
MEGITPKELLKLVVDIIKDAVCDIHIDYVSEHVAVLKDGNDSIHLEQKNDENGSSSSVFINDPREIIVSEDLLPALTALQHGLPGRTTARPKDASIVLNGLDVETYQILDAAKDAYDELNNSYQYEATLKKLHNEVTCSFKFGDHDFQITLVNQNDAIAITAETSAITAKGIADIIKNDTAKVQVALEAIYK